jgi:hypothetical protein
LAKGLATALHEGTVQDEKLLHRRRGDGALFCVHVGIGIIEEHQQIVQLQPTDAGVERPLEIGRTI